MENIVEGESIPPIAQTIILRVVGFMMSKASLALLVPIIIITNSIVVAQGAVFTIYMLFPVLLLVIFLIFYFRFRKNVLLNLEKHIKNIRFNPAEYKAIRIGLQKEDSEKNFEK